MMKICSKCKIEKDLSEFHRDNSRKDGFQYWCKQCISKRSKIYCRKNKVKRAKQHIKWVKENSKKLTKYNKIYGKIYREKNQKILAEKKQTYNNGKANYDTFTQQISWAKDPVRNVDGYLQTRCAYCGKWYYPTVISVQNRIKALNSNSNDGHENRLYCSIECKKVCPIFKKSKYQVGHPLKNENNKVREVQPELRQMVFERDKYTCLKCKRQDIVLHCHHIEGILWNPLESADIDQCMTVCKNCHKEIHQQEDCGYHDLQCKKAA